MKIGFSCFYNGPGGALTWIKAFSKYCVEKGYEVSYGFDTTVDVFCSVANLSTPNQLKSLKDKNIKILQRLNGIFLPYTHPDQHLIQTKNNEIKTLISYADAIVYQSIFAKEVLYRSIYNGSEPDGEIIYNCPVSNMFTPIGNKIVRPTDKKVIFTAAYWGLPDTAAKSMALLEKVLTHYKDRDDLEFWILGHGYERDEKNIRALKFSNIKKLDLSKPIPHNEIPSYIRSADIILHLKAHEGCSNMVVESIHCGTPLVGLNSGSLPELVGNGALLADCSTSLDTFPTVNIADYISKIDKTLENYSSFSKEFLNRSKLFVPETTFDHYLKKLEYLYNSK